MKELRLTQPEWDNLKSMVAECRAMLRELTKQTEKEVITPAEVCRILSISRDTYQEYVKSGVLHPMRLNGKDKGRTYISRVEINNMIEKGKL